MALNKTRVDYITKYAKKMAEACKGSGLYPSVMIAQGIIETSINIKGVWTAGASPLAVKYHNHFGIKDQKNDGWKGKSVNMKTGEVLEGKYVVIDDMFRVYNNDLEGFKDRVSFLKRNPRYTKNGVFNAGSPEEQAVALQKAGYATDPNYAKTIISVIVSYNLKKFD